MERLLTIDELSELLQIPKSTIYKWTHREEIPHVKLGRNTLRFRRSAIEKWIEKRSVKPNGRW